MFIKKVAGFFYFNFPICSLIKELIKKVKEWANRSVILKILKAGQRYLLASEPVIIANDDCAAYQNDS